MLKYEMMKISIETWKTKRVAKERGDNHCKDIGKNVNKEEMENYCFP